MAGSQHKATQRVQLFGASNLWLSRRAALAAVRRRFQGPLEIGLACGPGRSYGLTAGNPLVRYGALRDVDFQSTGPAASDLAILTDVGNDIAYNQTPETALAWIADFSERLEAEGAEVVLTGVPVESLRGLPWWLFFVLRTLYYAGQKVTQDDVLQRLADVEGGLRDLATQRGYLFLPTDPVWYGFDRFHLRSAHYDACWNQWLERLRPTVSESGPPTWNQIRQLRPNEYWYRGQPRSSQGEYDKVMAETRIFVR